MIDLTENKKNVFNIVLKNVNENFLCYKKMDSGVHSSVYLLNNKYIIKTVLYRRASFDLPFLSKYIIKQCRLL